MIKSDFVKEQKKCSYFEPKKVKYITIQDAKDYGQYFKIDIGDINFWHIVGEAYSITQEGSRIFVSIYPYYRLPIKLEIDNKENIFINK